VGTLDGKVAIVTGGAQGIGRAIADGLECDGATVVIADLDPPEGGIHADVSSETDVDAMVRETVDPMAASTSWSTTPASTPRSRCGRSRRSRSTSGGRSWT